MTKKLTMLAGIILCIIQINIAQTAAAPSTSAPAARTNRPSENTDPNNIQKNGIIKGNVVDDSSGEVIEYATIALFNKRLDKIMTGGITDQNGNFSIENIPMGMYDM